MGGFCLPSLAGNAANKTFSDKIRRMLFDDWRSLSPDNTDALSPPNESESEILDGINAKSGSRDCINKPNALTASSVVQGRRYPRASYLHHPVPDSRLRWPFHAEQSPQYRHQRQISPVVPPPGKLPRVLVHTTGRHQRINLPRLHWRHHRFINMNSFP